MKNGSKDPTERSICDGVTHSHHPHPMLDEELGVPSVIREYAAAFPQADILVVDNGSEDGTAAAARATGATLITEKRRGKCGRSRPRSRPLTPTWY